MMITTGNNEKSQKVTALCRRLPIGAEVVPGGVHFRVWAPLRKKVEIIIEGSGPDPDGSRTEVELHSEGDGYFSGLVRDALEGSLYRFRLDQESRLYPDPASRFQPLGPHGPSEVIDPGKFHWSDTDWRGMPIRGQVIYEMHIGTFTQEGTWKAASSFLPQLADSGMTVLELMPLADFPGRFGWGYDGVDFFAPTRLYGRPDELRAFIDAAHRTGLGVILDVVYNHQGPDGSYLSGFSKDYFTDRYQTEWGSAFNFDGPNSGPVREFILTNAGYWISEFHFDGLRLDATQTIFDSSSQGNIMAAITRRVRECAAGRPTIVVAENEPQHALLARSTEEGGYGMDSLWNDDFHHTARVALTGRTEAYYTDYRGTPQELISCIKRGFLYQGQHYSWQRKKRGTPSRSLKPEAFIVFTQNHDQVANSANGMRLHFLTSPGKFRAITALLLLAPETPMLFQGQEFCASTPFLYFADHKPELGTLVKKGRAAFLGQFPSLSDPETQSRLPDPTAQDTFLRSKLDLSERERNHEARALHEDLLRLRRNDPVFQKQGQGGLDGAVIGPHAFVLRYFGEDAGDRLVIVNLGIDLRLSPAPEPLLAPPEGQEWTLLWSSEDSRYGGSGLRPFDTAENWIVAGESAVVLMPKAGGKSNG